MGFIGRRLSEDHKKCRYIVQASRRTLSFLVLKKGNAAQEEPQNRNACVKSYKSRRSGYCSAIAHLVVLLNRSFSVASGLLSHASFSPPAFLGPLNPILV